ncbi:MAG: DUF4040 domain-containing protein [Defluviitaleaceae bacterium]|nr:DUF4040 domain-containing protein [Defluviitaleaceae bacterium]
MTPILLGFLIITGIFIVLERNIARIIIYLAIFSLIASVCYMLMGSPDVAMAEAIASAFTVIFFIICFEKYFSFTDAVIGTSGIAGRRIIPLVFTLGLFGLVMYFRPISYDTMYLGELYLANFTTDVGGENPVTAIYLGYRVYDTLFEALVVVVSVVAAIHLSAFSDEKVKTGQLITKETHSEVHESGLAVYAIQIICPLMLLYGVYLVLNGHLTPGGGFQGGLAIASFFICRYMIYNVTDLPIRKIIRMEELVFVSITIFAVSIVFLGAMAYLPEDLYLTFQIGYMLIMNGLIGLKVACGFIILFYRYIVIEHDGV